MSSTPKTVINVHPKLAVSIASGVGLAVITAVTGAVDPSLFHALGAYAPAAAAGVVALLSGLAGWLKSVDAEQGNGKAEQVEKAVEQTYADATAPVISVDKLVLDGFDAIIAGQADEDEPSERTAPATEPAGTQSSVIG